jgi:predicted nucleotidyltransferase component of viral defense system
MESTNKPIKLIFTHLPKATRKAFDLLSQESWLKEQGWYLAGGTALTLQADHRISVDLDFFTQHKDFDIEKINSTLSTHQWTTSLKEKGTIHGELIGAKISFLAYPYFVPKQPFITHGSINILDAQDIAVMKIIAISQRGRKRDFFDLYWYIKNREPLIDVLERVKIQYPDTKHNYHHIIKSLSYFEEAEEDPQPQIYFAATWDQVKKHFLALVPVVADKFL